jgi:alpha-tubulin suppressor-like RCC1 family protein
MLGVGFTGFNGQGVSTGGLLGLPTAGKKTGSPSDDQDPCALKQLAAGGTHSAALTNGGQLYMWGEDIRII